MRKPVLVLLLILGLSACAAPPLPEDHYYRLDLATPAATPAKVLLNDTLAVQRPRMDGVYGERPLLYSTVDAPGELRQYHYHYWSDSPARLIQDQLVIGLRAARTAREVVANADGATAKFQLGAVVRRFEQLRAGTSAKARVEIEFTLLLYGAETPLFSQNYRAELVARDGSPQAAAQALAEALTQCLAQFTADLRNAGLPAK